MDIKAQGEEELLAAQILERYPLGFFPMAMSAHDRKLNWYRPQFRGVLPLDGFHASKSLRRELRRHRDHAPEIPPTDRPNGSFCFRLNHEFETIMRHSAAREETWINEPIIGAFCNLHQRGYAHSLSLIIAGKLAGGIYGLALGGAFFAESMFSHQRNGSKFALWGLVTMLRRAGFALLDTQFLTDHLASLGGVEIDDHEYQALLGQALALRPARLAIPHDLIPEMLAR